MLSPESAQVWRELKRDISNLYKKDQRRRTTGTTSKFNFFDIVTSAITLGILIIVGACVIKILQWMWSF